MSKPTDKQIARLSEVGLFYDEAYNVVRCNTCGCHHLLCTCRKTTEKEGLS